MSEELKPCPFCGSKAAFVKYTGEITKVNVFCEKCCAELSGPWCNDPKIAEKLAFEKWNKRTGEKLLDSYRKAVYEILHITFIGAGAEVKNVAEYAHKVDNILIDVEGLAKWKN